MPNPKPRPSTLPSDTIAMKTGCGKIYTTITYDEDENPFEIFAQSGKSGNCGNAQLEPVCKLASHVLRMGVDVNIVIESMIGVRCPNPHISEYEDTRTKDIPKHVMGNNGNTLSCADGVAKSIVKSLGSRGWTKKWNEVTERDIWIKVVEENGP